MIEWLKALTPLVPALVALYIYLDSKRREQLKEQKETQRNASSLPPRKSKRSKR